MRQERLAAWLARPDTRVAVVGASGWIGMALVDRLLAACPGLGARLHLFGSAHRSIRIGGRTLQVGPLPVGEAILLEPGSWLILHAGIIGADRCGGDWIETRRRNDLLLEQVLGIAESVPALVVFFSSGAVHRPDFGSPDKQAYARMKADHERIVSDWAFGPDRLLIPRVFNLAGPFMTQARAYALGDFILSAAREGRIRIGAKGPVLRSFVHVGEMAEAVLDMAVRRPCSPAPFDVAGAEVTEIGELARVVGEVMALPGLVIERPDPIDGEPDRYVGEGSAYQAALAAAGGVSVPLPEMVADTLAWLRKTQPEAFQA